MVRVVGENVDVNIYSINKAKDMARQLGLDLVEISPNSIGDIREIEMKKDVKADSIYPFNVPVEYPKVGEDLTPARIGVIDLNTNVITWVKIP